MHIVQVCPTKNKKYYVNLSTLIFKWKNYFQQRTAARSAEIKKKERTVKKKKRKPFKSWLQCGGSHPWRVSWCRCQQLLIAAQCTGRDGAVCSGGRHTGLIRMRRLRWNWPGYTEMKSLRFGSLINSQDLHHLHFHAHRPSPVSDPYLSPDSTTYCCRLIAWYLFLVVPEGWRREDMFWQHCSKFYEFVTQFGRSSFESAETCLRCTVVCPHPVSPPGWVSIIHKRWVANLKLITLMLFILHFKWTNT